MPAIIPAQRIHRCSTCWQQNKVCFLLSNLEINIINSLITHTFTPPSTPAAVQGNNSTPHDEETHVYVENWQTAPLLESGTINYTEIEYSWQKYENAKLVLFPSLLFPLDILPKLFR